MLPVSRTSLAFVVGLLRMTELVIVPPFQVEFVKLFVPVKVMLADTLCVLVLPMKLVSTGAVPLNVEDAKDSMPATS